MDEKKEIGRKIWDLFSKGYSYGQIAKELNVSKSVVSNVINYTLPTKDWCNENIKELKEKHKNEIEQLKEECLDFVTEEKIKEKKEVIENATIIFTIATAIFLNVDDFYIDFFSKIFNKNWIFSTIALLIFATLIIAIFYFLLKYLTKDK